MHRRLTVIYLTLIVIATLGLAVPLGLAVIDRESRGMLLDRTADAARFSSMAQNAVLSGEAGVITAELQTYSRLYGIDAMVIDAEADPVAVSGPDLTLGHLQESAGEPADESAETVLAALAGVRQDYDETIWPWTTEQLLVAEPVNDSGETIGAVVTSSPTETVTRSMWIQWAVVVAGLTIILALGVMAVRPISRWVMRPVGELARAADAVRGGELGAQVSTAAGPVELKQLGSAFNEMSATIAQMLHRQRSFVAYAGHQIRNPLAVVRLRVESLAQSLPAELMPAHRGVLEEIDRLTRTCQGLLNLALPTQLERYRVHVVLSEVAQQRREAWMPIADQLGAHIELQVPEGLEAHMVEHTLDQTLDVLIDNALKFGGPGVSILVTAHRNQADQTELVVADDGPGLPDGMLEEAVVPFWRRLPVSDQPGDAEGPQTSGSAEHGAAEGTGLGLSAVVSLLELDAGQLTLHQRDPHGIRAVILLDDPAPPDDELV